MPGFSIAEAAFTGFRVIRAHPSTIAIWAVIQLVLNFANSALMVVAAGPALMQLQSVQARADPAAVFATLGRLAPLYAGLLLFSLILYPVIYAAMNRVVLRPSDSGMAYLRLGADELRQFLLIVVYGFLLVAAYIALLLVAVILGILVGLIMGVLGGAGPVAGAILAVILVFVVFGALIFLAVRLSLASAQTFDTGKLNIFGSWALTRGRFWPIFAAYLLSWVACALVLVIVVAVAGAVEAAVGGANGLAAFFSHPDTSSVAAFFGPGRIVYLLLSAIASAIIFPIAMTPSAAVYRALTGTRVDAVFS